ncbi:hypothetical protein H4P12_07730 [Paracoccus sp. 11-3]|uniref:Uncharacterized protein n=1 Tax=Paracoccus amoyensis TaxID=2760093 RepID=A0A926G8T8_9RHOB|nr:hypothetical protein [Paracoccus amoyensis]MBC9246603.1 hypothetical protein [Paracoccus amoyensis]
MHLLPLPLGGSGGIWVFKQRRSGSACHWALPLFLVDSRHNPMNFPVGVFKPGFAAHIESKERLIMPLPQFLLMLVAVVLAAMVTLWATVSAGVPMFAVLLVTLGAAALLHYTQRDHHDHDG